MSCADKTCVSIAGSNFARPRVELKFWDWQVCKIAQTRSEKECHLVHSSCRKTTMFPRLRSRGLCQTLAPLSKSYTSKPRKLQRKLYGQPCLHSVLKMYGLEVGQECFFVCFVSAVSWCESEADKIVKRGLRIAGEKGGSGLEKAQGCVNRVALVDALSICAWCIWNLELIWDFCCQGMHVIKVVLCLVESVWIWNEFRH